MQKRTAAKKKRHDKDSTRQSGIMGSVLKTFEILEVFGRKRKPLSVAELCCETARPKSSIHRVLSTLTRTGAIEQNERSEYQLTLKLWRIGVLALGEIDVLKIAQPHLEALSRAADETVHLAILEQDGDIVYLTKVESPRSIRVQTQVGKVSPSWCTATGRALIAFDHDMRQKILSRPKKKFTPLTITDTDQLRERLNDVMRDGYAVTLGENHPEMGGIAAPIRNHSDIVVASCGVAIPAFRMDAELIERCTKLVLKTATAISTDLGHMRQNVHPPRINKLRLSEFKHTRR